MLKPSPQQSETPEPQGMVVMDAKGQLSALVKDTRRPSDGMPTIDPFAVLPKRGRRRKP